MSSRLKRKISRLLGFTLVELLVVFSLISVITGIGFVSLVNYSRSQVVTQAAQDLKQEVDIGKFDALSSVKPALPGQCTSTDQLTSYTLSFCPYSTQACYNTQASYELVAQCGTKSVPIHAPKLPQAVSFSNANIDPSLLCKRITFTARTGVLTGVPCQIYLKSAGTGNVLISIDENGSTTVQ